MFLANIISLFIASSLWWTATSTVNVILVIADGYGPASMALARQAKAVEEGKPVASYSLALDALLVGSARTSSANSLVTDSAAAATAYACGIHTNNTMVAVHPDGTKACRSLLEEAKARGMVTGLVVRSAVTDATPAAFTAHVRNRGMEDSIAEQQVASESWDLLMGGGHCRFVPLRSANKQRSSSSSHDDLDKDTDEGTTANDDDWTKSCRSDHKDLLQASRDRGVKVILGSKQFHAWQPGHTEDNNDGSSITLDSPLQAQQQREQQPVLCLLAPEDMPYAIDQDVSKHSFTLANSHSYGKHNPDTQLNGFDSIIRHNEEEKGDDDAAAVRLPSMAQKALDFLHARSKAKGNSGFFLLLEASRIDTAGHANDAATQYREVLAYQQTIQVLHRFIRRNPEDSLLVALADHETGGLAIGGPIGWSAANDQKEAKPADDDHQNGASKSMNPAASSLLYDWNPKAVLAQRRSSGHLALLYDHYKGCKKFFCQHYLFPRMLGIPMEDIHPEELTAVLKARDPNQRAQVISALVSSRAGLSWAHHGHTAVDIAVYADGYASEMFRGHQDNTEIHSKLRKVMLLD